MFSHDSKLQYPVTVQTPDSRFARLLQQAIGGVEGEIRVCLQYLFQAFGARGPVKYRDLLMETGTEEISHIQILATAVALNLEGAVADMYANVTAEATGRVLACRLLELTDDPGMKDMLRFLIARDTMHQQQWLAVIEELSGAQANLPIPNSFDVGDEIREVSYDFVSTGLDGVPIPEGRWSSGPSLDGLGECRVRKASPLGDKPRLAPPMPQG